MTKQKPSSPSFTVISCMQSWMDTLSNGSSAACSWNCSGSSPAGSGAPPTGRNGSTSASPCFAFCCSLRISRSTRARHSSICSVEFCTGGGGGGAATLEVGGRTYACGCGACACGASRAPGTARRSPAPARSPGRGRWSTGCARSARRPSTRTYASRPLCDATAPPRQCAQ